MSEPINLPELNRYAPKFKGRSANLSRLMLLKAESDSVANVCPYGCDDNQLDEHGYCHHLVGFTVPHKDSSQGENKKIMEPLGYDMRGNRAVQGAKRCKVPDGAHLERITVVSRVYDKNAVKTKRPGDFDDFEETDDERAERELAEEAELQTA